MSREQLHIRLMSLPPEDLVDFIAGLWGRDEHLNRQIEMLAQRMDLSGRSSKLITWIDTMVRRSGFVNYRQCFDYAEEVGTLVDEIESLLKDGHADDALTATGRLIDGMDAIMETVDDSAGVLGPELERVYVIWLQAAARARESGRDADWVAQVQKFNSSNDYGLADDLLPNASILLTPTELQELARQYEEEASRESTKSEDSWSALSARVAMGQVAVALRDPELYIRSVVISSPEPNELQRADIAKTCLEMDAPEEALKWLDGPWKDEARRLDLCAQVYAATGDQDQLLEMHRQQWQTQGTWYSLEAYLEHLPTEQHQAVVGEALKRARESDHLIYGLEILIGLDSIAEAESLLVNRHSELQGRYYGSLLEFVETFESKGHFLASTLIHRALLDDILARAYSKAYTHAARYYRQLDQLQARIRDWQGMSEHTSYLRSLWDQHYRKYSFWDRVGGKPDAAS